MLRTKAVDSPTLNTKGQFVVRMDEFSYIQRDPVKKSITGTATGGAAVIPMTDTSGFAVGQTIVIQDSVSHETLIILTVTAGVSLTASTNLVNTYTVARGGSVTVADVTLPITGTATGGGTNVPMANTTGMLVAQVLVIEDANGAETVVVQAVTPGVSITTTANLVNSYTVAAGGKVTVVNGNPVRASVPMPKPFAAAAGSAQFIDSSWAVGTNVIVVTVEKATAAGGPALPYSWAVAVTADVVGAQFVATADGE